MSGPSVTEDYTLWASQVSRCGFWFSSNDQIPDEKFLLEPNQTKQLGKYLLRYIFMRINLGTGYKVTVDSSL